MDKGASFPKVQYLYGKLECKCDRYKQERNVSYPRKSVYKGDKYPTKEGKDAPSGVSKRRRERYRWQQRA